MNPRYRFYRHTEKLIELLEAIANDELRRLMVFMPPRHGKSELVSRLFPAYYLYRHTDRWAGINSYAAKLAYTFSRNVRDNYLRIGGTLKEDAAAMDHWETGQGGGLWAAGVGGPITGKGFHLGIIDDPLKNAEEASSQAIRDKQKDWYDSTFYTRAEPNEAIVVVQTRWHEDDLSGRLLEQEGTEDAEGWTVVNYEAIRSASPRTFPDTCVVMEDWRAPGEPLCPERYPLARLAKIKSKSAYFWSALYQQAPAPQEGGMWQRSWFSQDQTFTAAPVGLRSIGYDWDTAYTKDDKNAATAYVKTGVDAQGNVYVLDAGFRWVETPAAEQWMASLGGPHYVEAKASGKSIVQLLKARGLVAIEVQVFGGADKIARTTMATPIAEAGRLFVAAHIRDMLLDDDRQGILKFPNGSHADLNDALVQAIHRHNGKNRTRGGASITI